MNTGDVVQILIGDYQGKNGLVVKIKKDRVLIVVDPFGKQIWLNKEDVK